MDVTFMSVQEIELTIPGSAEFLRLARLAVADAGSRVGFSFEEIDDLRIAVDELCFALANGEPEVRLNLKYQVGENKLTVEGHCDRDGAAPVLSDLAEAILTAVVDEYHLGNSAAGVEFQFAKALAGS